MRPAAEFIVGVKFTGNLTVGRASLISGIEVGRLRAGERLSLLSSAHEDKSLRMHVGAVFRQLHLRLRTTDARLRTEIGVSRAF